jgi:hypothetical protein
MSDNIPSLFDHLNNLTVDKTDWSEEDGFRKNYTQYMVNRFTGMNDMLLPFISEINMLRDLPDDVHYNLLKEYLPRQKMWFKYISRIKKEDVNIVNNIMEFYDCSEDEAIDYLELLPKDMIKDIEKFYDAGGKVSSRKR